MTDGRSQLQLPLRKSQPPWCGFTHSCDRAPSSVHVHQLLEVWRMLLFFFPFSCSFHHTFFPLMIPVGLSPGGRESAMTATSSCCTKKTEVKIRSFICLGGVRGLQSPPYGSYLGLVTRQSLVRWGSAKLVNPAGYSTRRVSFRFSNVQSGNQIVKSLQ